MPWRETGDPYAIWVSEVMLQQTRVEQMLPYFSRFKKLFPSVKKLASAREQSILKAWEGLGYYSRARNLHKAAKAIVKEHGGRIPSDYADLLSLPGIGPYSAAAIASIAYNREHAVLDGNAFRVLARFQGKKGKVITTKSLRWSFFNPISIHLLDRRKPNASYKKSRENILSPDYHFSGNHLLLHFFCDSCDHSNQNH